MPSIENSLVIKKYDGIEGNFVDSQYLGKAYEIKPTYLETMITRIFSARSDYFPEKFMVGYMSGMEGGVQEIDDEIYRWYLAGAEDHEATSLGPVDAGATNLGLGKTTFRIWLDYVGFEEPDVLMGEDPDLPLEVIGSGTPYGGGRIYTVRLQTDDVTAYFPSYLLEPGRRFSKVWTSARSERNDKFGTQQSPATFLLESQVGAFAQKFEVTDKAWRLDGALGVSFMYTDANGKDQVAKTFLPYAEARMHNELVRGMEVQAIYGKKSQVLDESGYWKRTSPGVREQLKAGWTEYYSNPLSADMLKDYLLNVFVTRVDEPDRDIIGMTGQVGSIALHDALASIAGNFLTVDTNFIEKAPDRRHISVGGQYTHYVGPEGIGFKVKKHYLNDSFLVDKRPHPDFPNLPLDSQRITFLDFGNNMSEGTKNIVALKVKDTYRWGYQAGTHTPTGPVKGGSVTNLIAGYTMFTEGTFGVCVKDPSRGGELIFDTNI